MGNVRIRKEKIITAVVGLVVIAIYYLVFVFLLDFKMPIMGVYFLLFYTIQKFKSLCLGSEKVSYDQMQLSDLVKYFLVLQIPVYIYAHFSGQQIPLPFNKILDITGLVYVGLDLLKYFNPKKSKTEGGEN